MKNILISIVLGLFVASCAQTKYANLDSQYTNNRHQSFNAKYNNKNYVDSDKHKKQIIRQIAIATQE